MNILMIWPVHTYSSYASLRIRFEQYLHKHKHNIFRAIIITSRAHPVRSSIPSSSTSPFVVVVFGGMCADEGVSKHRHSRMHAEAEQHPSIEYLWFALNNLSSSRLFVQDLWARTQTHGATFCVCVPNSNFPFSSNNCQRPSNCSVCYHPNTEANVQRQGIVLFLFTLSNARQAFFLFAL